MANSDYVTKNKLTVEVDTGISKRRKKILLFGIPFALLISFIHIIAGIVALLFVLILRASATGSAIIRAGAEGEDIAIETLMALPDDYTVFNQVDIPNAKSRTGVNEADIIVTGPGAMFVIEVKHNNSAITGSENDREWTISKVGRGGGEYTKTMRNPIAQVKKLVWLLGDHLKSRNAKPWIQGVVLFTNSNASVSISGETSLPVLTIDQIVGYIQSYMGRSNADVVARAIDVIKALKAAD